MEYTHYLVNIDITTQIQFKVTFVFQEDSAQDVFLNRGAGNTSYHILDSAIKSQTMYVLVSV